MRVLKERGVEGEVSEGGGFKGVEGCDERRVA